MGTIIVTGSGAGLGKEIVKALTGNNQNIIGIDIKSVDYVFVDYSIDITKPGSWKGLLDKGVWDDVVGVINCAGVNKICAFEEITMEDYTEVMDVNLKGILLTSQYFQKTLAINKGFIVNVVSNASHIPMTDSFVYNASKGAAAIATKQMARELTRRHGITVFGISPNKLAGTEMSDYIDRTFPPMRGLSYEEGRKYQLNGLLTGKETDPKQIAELMAFLLAKKERHEYLSGCILELGL